MDHKHTGAGPANTPAVPENLREFVEAVAGPMASYIDRETDEHCCAGCHCAEIFVGIGESAREVHADDCIVLRARALLASTATPASAPRSADDMTTVPCPCCGHEAAVGCDECDGRGRIIVSSADIATPASAQPADDLTTAIAYIADELEADAMNHDGDFADTVKGCVDALRHLIEHSPVPSAQPVAAAPAGWKLVPRKITPQMIERALEAHYGKRRVRAVGGASGVDMTVNDTNWTGVDFMRRIWPALLDAAPAAPVAPVLTLDNASIGTTAPAIGGGHWYRTENGWKWNGPDGTGGTFPRPGGDWNGELIAPAAPAAPVAQDKQEQRESAGRTGAATCWSCDRPYTEQQRSDADGHCPHCGVEIELVDSEGGHHD